MGTILATRTGWNVFFQAVKNPDIWVGRWVRHALPTVQKSEPFQRVTHVRPAAALGTSVASSKVVSGGLAREDGIPVNPRGLWRALPRRREHMNSAAEWVGAE